VPGPARSRSRWLWAALLPVLAFGRTTSALADPHAWLFQRSRVSLVPEMVMDYAATMMGHRLNMSVLASGDAREINAPEFKRWRWRAADGSVVQRVADGRFRITFGDCVSSMCRATVCDVVLWPQLMCSDGQERTISAPDLRTVTIDGVTFARFLPAPDPELPDEAPPPTPSAPERTAP
jgi:hypothetical protein